MGSLRFQAAFAIRCRLRVVVTSRFGYVTQLVAALNPKCKTVLHPKSILIGIIAPSTRERPGLGPVNSCLENRRSRPGLDCVGDAVSPSSALRRAGEHPRLPPGAGSAQSSLEVDVASLQQADRSQQWPRGISESISYPEVAGHSGKVRSGLT